MVVCAVLFALLLFSAYVSVDGQWCATSTMSLPAPQSNSIQWFGSGDNECSAFFFSANAIGNSTAEAVIGVTSETLQLLNKSAPIPTAIRAAGYRYINDIDVWPELLFAPMSKELPSSSSSVPAVNTTGAIVVLRSRFIQGIQSRGVRDDSPLSWTTYDYSSQILYAGGAGILERVYTFAVEDSTWKLTRTADIVLTSPLTNFVQRRFLCSRSTHDRSVRTHRTQDEREHDCQLTHTLFR